MYFDAAIPFVKSKPGTTMLCVLGDLKRPLDYLGLMTWRKCCWFFVIIVQVSPKANNLMCFEIS